MAFDNYDKCSLLLPMDGANNGTTFTDWSPVAKTITVAGNAKTLTAESKYYGSSGYFDGTGDYLSTTYATATYDWWTQDYTISVWVNPTLLSTFSYTQLTVIPVLISNGTVASTTNYWSFGPISDGVVRFYYFNGSTQSVSSTLTIAQSSWSHIAFVHRLGVGIQIYVNGVGLASPVAVSGTPQSSTGQPLVVGQINSRSINGYLQDLQIIKGAALWTADFTPPTRLVGQISGTVSDITGAAAARTVSAIPRTNPTRVFQTTSSAVDGSYSLRVPATEVTRVAFAQEASVYNDLVARIIPE